MPPETLSSYYKENFGSLRHLQGQIVNAGINAWAITKFVDMNEIKEVLDIGTGYGFLLQELAGTFNVEQAGTQNHHFDRDTFAERFRKAFDIAFE